MKAREKPGNMFSRPSRVVPSGAVTVVMVHCVRGRVQKVGVSP